MREDDEGRRARRTYMGIGFCCHGCKRLQYIPARVGHMGITFRGNGKCSVNFHEILQTFFSSSSSSSCLYFNVFSRIMPESLAGIYFLDMM